MFFTQGAGASGPLRVFPWERRFVRSALAADRGGDGAATTAYLSVERGNGKMAIVSALATAALVGPLVRPRGEVMVCASSFEQGLVAFRHIFTFMGPTIERGPKRWRIQDSADRASIEDRETGARVRCLGSDPHRAHGVAPAMVITDEPAQWEPSTADAMLAVLKTGLGKIEGGRFWALGTMSASETH